MAQTLGRIESLPLSDRRSFPRIVTALRDSGVTITSTDGAATKSLERMTKGGLLARDADGSICVAVKT